MLLILIISWCTISMLFSMLGFVGFQLFNYFSNTNMFLIIEETIVTKICGVPGQPGGFWRSDMGELFRCPWGLFEFRC